MWLIACPVCALQVEITSKKVVHPFDRLRHLVARRLCRVVPFIMFPRLRQLCEHVVYVFCLSARFGRASRCVEGQTWCPREGVRHHYYTVTMSRCYLP